MEGIGLRTANASDRVALRGVRVRSRLSGMSQRTIVEQVFVNLEARAIEGVYTFPLPENAAVCGFEVITADRVLTGIVEENEKAIQKYDEAIDAGHGAFMVEQDRPDIFTARVGNLKPGQTATIRLTYVCPLELADRQIRIAYPSTVAPRYVTDTGMNDPVQTAVDGDAVNPPHALDVPYGLTLEVEVRLGRAIKAISSPSHGVRWEEDRVTLAGGMTEMNRDIVLTIDLAKDAEPMVEVEAGPDGDTFLAVTFLPEFDPAEAGAPRVTETVFLLDCSGSMQGDSIEQAKLALELCLRSLSPGDAFNICRFGSSFELMSSEPLIYNEHALRQAIAYVRASGDLGGTELHPPLQRILAAPVRKGTVRQVILLTDGQVSNEPAVLALARQHRTTNRIFSFGIGSACSASLVRGLARATAGAAEFITAGERIDHKVLRTFSRIASPAVMDVRIDWGNADVQTLAELPPVFDGDVLTVYARVSGRLPERIELKCRMGEAEKRWRVPAGRSGSSLDAPNPASRPGAIALMWARRAIQSLEEVNGVYRSTRATQIDAQRQRLIPLSKQFGLLCSLTTFVAVEHRSLEERNEGRPELRRVPVMLAAGRRGMAAGLLDLCMAPDVARSLPAHMACCRTSTDEVRARTLLAHSAEADRVGLCSPEMGAAYNDSVGVLLQSQSADGYFESSASTDAVLDISRVDHVRWRAAIESSLPPFDASRHPRARIVFTTLILLLLRQHLAAHERLWRRAATKAQAWLGRAFSMKPEQVTQWMDALAANNAA